MTEDELLARIKRKHDQAEAARRAAFEAQFAASPIGVAGLVGPPRPAQLHLDYLALTGPKDWLREQECKDYRAEAHGAGFPASPYVNALGNVLSPVLAVDGEHAGESVQVAQLVAEGFDRGNGDVWCPEWFGQQRVGWATCKHGIPAVTLTGAVLRRLGWQSAYMTTVELFRRLARPPAFNVSRVDVAVEYPVIDFERLRAYRLDQAMSDLALDLWNCLLRVAGRREVRRELYESDDGTTHYVRVGKDLVLRVYHKRGEGVRVEFEVRRPRPKGEYLGTPDPHQQVAATVLWCRELFGANSLPFVAEEPAVPVDPETGEVLYAGVGVLRQQIRTIWRRGVGLCRGVLQGDEEELRQLLELAERVEKMITQRYPTEAIPPRWVNVESLDAQWAREDDEHVG